MRLGNEVFLCPQYRSSALGKNLIFFGVFFSHPFHPLSNLVLFLDVGAYDLEKSVDKTTPNESTSIFRVAPIQHVAKVPAGKVYEDWVELVDSAASLACGFFENLTAKGKTLQDLDFIPSKPKAPSSTDQKMMTRSKKAYHRSLKDDPQRALSNRTASKILQAMSKANSTLLQKEQAKSAKLAVENKALKEALSEAKAEISALKKHVNCNGLQSSSTTNISKHTASRQFSKKCRPLITEGSTSSQEPSPEYYKLKQNHSKHYLVGSSEQKCSPHRKYIAVKQRRSPSPQVVMRSNTATHSGWHSTPSSSPEYIAVKPRSSPRFKKRKGDMYSASDFVHRYKV